MYKRMLLLGISVWLFIGAAAQQIREIDREGIVDLAKMNSDTTYVINFWATWCSPCVKEIGYFEELHRDYSSDKVQVVLVSLDFPNQLDRRVVPFLKEKEITAPVRLVTELDYNSWIDQVDPSWSGALPATLILHKDKRLFLEKELTKDELFEHVEQILN
ncbi:MAG: TlpA disulfide reductase family protein [Bacteroidales bacterium]